MSRSSPLAEGRLVVSTNPFRHLQIALGAVSFFLAWMNRQAFRLLVLEMPIAFHPGWIADIRKIPPGVFASADDHFCAVFWDD